MTVATPSRHESCKPGAEKLELRESASTVSAAEGERTKLSSISVVDSQLNAFRVRTDVHVLSRDSLRVLFSAASACSYAMPAGVQCHMNDPSDLHFLSHVCKAVVSHRSMPQLPSRWHGDSVSRAAKLSLRARGPDRPASPTCRHQAEPGENLSHAILWWPNG